MRWLSKLLGDKKEARPPPSALDEARWMDRSSEGSRHTQAAERSRRPAQGGPEPSARGGSMHGSRRGGSSYPYEPATQQPRRQLPVQQDGTISLLDAARDLQDRRWGPRGGPPAPQPVHSKTVHPTTSHAGAEAGHAAAALAAPAVAASPDLWGGSRRQPTGGAPAQQQQQWQRHSGAPGAPASPDPSVPPSLRRVSSQPHTALPSGSGCSAATGSTPAHASGWDSTSLEGSRSSRHSSTTGAAGTGALLPCQASMPVPVAAAAGAKPAVQQRQAGAAGEQAGSGQVASPPPPMRWHPALGGSRQPDTAAPAPASVARQPSSRAMHDTSAASATGLASRHAGLGPLSPSQPAVTHVPVSLVSVAAAAAAAEADEEEDCLLSPTATMQRSGSAQSVSLLTFMLKGPSAASSMANSRETSVRSGIARSREASVRSGSRRTPVGGLTLALSRENSVKGGQAACASRERSVRDGSVRSVRSSSGRPPSASPLERSVSSGQRTYRGLQLADNRPTEPAHHLRRLEEAFGCGSADWMGNLPPARLADMLDSCEHSVAPGAALQDPFVLGASPGAASGSRRSSHAATCRPSKTIPEEEREELFDIQPQEVGSWAKRVTTFDNAKPLPSEPPATHHGGPDPLLLTAALEALAAAPPCPGSGPNCHQMLVGDSALATTTELSVELQAANMAGPHHHHLHVASWHAGCSASASGGGSSGPDVLPCPKDVVHLLSSSWDVADAALVREPMQMVQLGGSAPTAPPASLPPPSKHGSGPNLQRLGGSQPLPPLAAGDVEWNRAFMRRWRTVKKHAYLQALGLRALWRVHSPSDRHEPLELLTNDLPQHDNGMRRAYAGIPAAHRPNGSGNGVSAARPMLRQPSSGALHKDPSLATLLLGEVAEVC